MKIFNKIKHKILKTLAKRCIDNFKAHFLNIFYHLNLHFIAICLIFVVLVVDSAHKFLFYVILCIWLLLPICR